MLAHSPPTKGKKKEKRKRKGMEKRHWPFKSSENNFNCTEGHATMGRDALVMVIHLYPYKIMTE